MAGAVRSGAAPPARECRGLGWTAAGSGAVVCGSRWAAGGQAGVVWRCYGRRSAASARSSAGRVVLWQAGGAQAGRGGRGGEVRRWRGRGWRGRWPDTMGVETRVGSDSG